MAQAFGYFSGNDATVYQSSGNFTVAKQSAGKYLVTLNESPSNGGPAVAVSVISAYLTAKSIVQGNGDPAAIIILTGYSDQNGPMDVDYVSFIAQWI